MVSLTRFKCSFTPKWQMSVLALVSIGLFTALGIWQIKRAHQKQVMLDHARFSLTQQTILWQPAMKWPSQYQFIDVQGRFLPDVFLLDNQHHQHQFGYDVLSPLQLSNGNVLLVDRGWLAGDITRRTLPEVDFIPNWLTLSGQVYYPSINPWILGPSSEKKSPHLVIVERIDVKLISQFLHKSVYPFIIRLKPDSQSPYVREWATVSMPPERHFAYAIQWFAMALVIFFLWIILNLKKNDEK